jgi:hypothetical protein
VNEPGAPPPDWDAIFHDARRRVLGRVLAVAAIGAAGAIFLLGGGLSAQGTVHWRTILGQSAKSESKPTASKKHRHHHNGKPHHGNHGGGNQSGTPQNGNHHHGHHPKKKQQPEHHHHAQWNPCAGDAAEVEYCEAIEEPPTTGEPAASVESGTASH